MSATTTPALSEQDQQVYAEIAQHFNGREGFTPRDLLHVTPTPSRACLVLSSHGLIQSVGGDRYVYLPAPAPARPDARPTGFAVAMEQDQWGEARAALAWAGYMRHHNDIDAEVASMCYCGSCGAPLVYEGYRRPGSYRAFTVCLSCDAAAEF